MIAMSNFHVLNLIRWQEEDGNQEYSIILASPARGRDLEDNLSWLGYNSFHCHRMFVRKAIVVLNVDDNIHLSSS